MCIRDRIKSAAVHYRLKLLAAYLLALNKCACDCMEPVEMCIRDSRQGEPGAAKLPHAGQDEANYRPEAGGRF